MRSAKLCHKGFEKASTLEFNFSKYDTNFHSIIPKTLF